MKKYEILEHATDLKIRAFGKTKKELFANMLYGMFEAIKPKIQVSTLKKVARLIEINATDEVSLLVDFLSEVLYQSDINNEAYFGIQFEKLTDKKLRGKIFGQPIERFVIEIKAVTYHGLEIKKVNDHWEAVVLFDV